MGAIVLACLLAGGLGLLAGAYYSMLGWMVVGSLLFVTACAGLIVAGAPPLVAVGWIGVTLLTFNLCLLAALTIRLGMRAKRA